MNTSVVIPSGLLITSLTPSFVAHCALFVAIVLVWTIVCGQLFKKMTGLPVIAGQILGGIILGPSCINLAQQEPFGHVIWLNDAATGAGYAFVSSDLFLFFLMMLSAAFTVSYLLWIAGHETDVNDIAVIGGLAVSGGILGALLPIGMIAGLVTYCFAGWSSAQAIALGLIFSATSVSIPVAMLFSYRQMHLKSSKATLGAAVVDDIFAVVLLSLFFLTVQAGIFGCGLMPDSIGHGCSLSGSLLWMFAGFVLLGLAGFFAVIPVIRWLEANEHTELIAPLATGIMFFYFSGSELIGGLAGITGAYFAGLFHRMADGTHAAQKVISPFASGVLLPLFLGTIGFQVNVQLLSASDWVLVAALLAMAVISKMVGCWLASALSGFFGGTRLLPLEIYLFGSSMVARGEVGLVISSILYGAQIIDPSQYVIAVVVIVLTTVVSPIMLSIGFKKLAMQQ